MNFPKAQQTGALAELQVNHLFTAWGWTVGKDLIDTGYDFCIEPASEQFLGQRFLVQVKGTSAQKRGRVVAPVSKNRLRQYSVNPIPVFLIRATADGRLYWLHIQDWACGNLKRLEGDGETGISLPSDQTLDHDQFVAYLVKIFQPVEQRPDSLKQLLTARSAYLSSIDPELGVRISIANGVENYEVFAKSPNAKLQFRINPIDNEHRERLRDAITYGVPAQIDVADFSVSGSHLLHEMGLQEVRKGTVSIRPTRPTNGSLEFCPGPIYSLLENSISLSAHLNTGHGGFSISNVASGDVLQAAIKGAFQVDGTGQTQVTLSLNEHALSAHPIQEIAALAALEEWAVRALENEAFSIVMRFRGARIPLIVKQDTFKGIRDLLLYLLLLGRLHKITKMLNSSLVIKDLGDGLSESEIQDIHLVYALLRGERKRVKISHVDGNINNVAAVANAGIFVIKTGLALQIRGEEIGVIPVAIDLSNYNIEGDEKSKFRLVADDQATALLYYQEHGENSGPPMRRGAVVKSLDP